MSIQRRTFLATLGGSVAASTAGCLGSFTDDTAEGAITGEELTLTTTTSTYDTGLLDEVNAPFQDRFGVTVDTVSQGTGAALQTARNGDSDVVMVHARSLEDEFISEGYGVNRRDLMFNDFVIVGSADDPAGIAGMEAATDALETIAETESMFISRGDNSGTHTKELGLWDAAGVEISSGGEWYLEAGQGMGEVLTQADQQGAYTLADRGTYLSMRSDIGLEILVEGPVEGGPEALMNPYGIVAVNPAVHENVSYDLAMAYIGFITGPVAQEIIEEHTVNGEQLFFPESLSENPNFDQYVPEGWRNEENDADE
ncbi:substrate-binding domain-containing protein [Halobacteria archaeon AArc-curdl1]|uniref:Substrate-binding domain-containing protein n=1 Tax=Natronosalvus hydrolyticus TaxID=2979988 RepID=A0AAP2ZAH1_9EURY|nr:substrate-binding domain-containing protein [Halobacteria archaeon AArc-curdl1]